MAPSAPVHVFSQDSGQRIGALDICGSTVPVLASGGEMPCVTARVFGHHHAVSLTAFEQRDPLFQFLSIPFPIEQPPRS